MSACQAGQPMAAVPSTDDDGRQCPFYRQSQRLFSSLNLMERTAFLASRMTPAAIAGRV